MNTEDKKRLELIKSFVEEQGADGDKHWLIEQFEAAEARCAELEALFALQRTRMAEATEAWRKAKGKYDILPDLGDLLAWLMDRPAALEAQMRRLREVLEYIQDHTITYDFEKRITAALAEPQKRPTPPGGWTAARERIERFCNTLDEDEPQEGKEESREM